MQSKIVQALNTLLDSLFEILSQILGAVFNLLKALLGAVLGLLAGILGDLPSILSEQTFHQSCVVAILMFVVSSLKNRMDLGIDCFFQW